MGGQGGKLKTSQNLIVSYEQGQREVIFTPPPPEKTEFLLTELFSRYHTAQREAQAHPLVLISALILDFLAIHPVADGNGRLARLITTYELLAKGYGMVRYVSLEQRIYKSKNTYYASLYESQREWHNSQHNIWPWTSYLIRVLADGYDVFEQRIAAAGEITGSKQERVYNYILHQASEVFSRRDIERALPDISSATIRLVLSQLRAKQQITSLGSGPGARWHRSKLSSRE